PPVCSGRQPAPRSGRGRSGRGVGRPECLHVLPGHRVPPSARRARAADRGIDAPRTRGDSARSPPLRAPRCSMTFAGSWGRSALARESEMPIINSSSTEARNLRGLHLYHFSMSNCSQKARFCLEEKGLHWTSHPVDLSNNQHLTPEFVAINPKGLVPVLVHDGVVVTESSDIIDYVDQHFPDPPLRP